MDWNALVEGLGPRLYKYFCARFSETEAQDLTQETLVRLVRKVREGKFDPARGNISMLAFGIAHYVGMENNRPRQWESVETFDHLEDPSPSLEDGQIGLDLSLKIRTAMKQLSSLEEQILCLCIDEELSLAQIAQILQLPLGTVKSHIFRAKKKLIALAQKEALL